MSAHLRVAIAIAALGATTPALAAQRTFVASTGSDSNGCSAVAPCRSFATAMTHTDPNGEIVVLDSAGYGRVTVDRSVTITAPAGVYAGISVFGSTNGIDVNANGSKVVLRGLTINGQGGDYGIHYIDASRLTVENCVIANMGVFGIRAIAPNGRLVVTDTVIRGTADSGMEIAGGVHAVVSGVRIEASGDSGVDVIGDVAGTTLTMTDTEIVDSGGIGLNVFAGAGPTTVRAEVKRTQVSGSLDFGLIAQAAASSTALLSIADSVVSGGGNYGIASFGPGNAKVVVADSTVVRNAFQGFAQSTGAFFSKGNSVLHDNNGGLTQTTGTIQVQPVY